MKYKLNRIKEIWEEYNDTIILGIVFILLWIAVIGMMLMGDIAEDNACKTIGYDKSVGGAFQEKYCVNKTSSQKVIFSNCGFFNCEVYKIESESREIIQ